MSSLHHIWRGATLTRQRFIQFTLVALLAFAAGAATASYGGAITTRFAGKAVSSAQQALPIQPEVPAVALPRSEASPPTGDGEYVHPPAPAISMPQGETSHGNAYWEYLRLSVSGLAVPEEVQEESQPHGYWEYVRPDSAD